MGMFGSGAGHFERGVAVVSVEKFLKDRIELHCGDCLAVMPTLAENLFDSACCDPPYHLSSIVKRFGAEGAAFAKVGKTGAYARASAGFMNKTWDGGDIAFRAETWAHVLRVLKPGAYLAAFGGTRTGHRVACAIEDAGFILHPFIAWLFGQGFPKAHRVTASGLTDLDRATGGWEGWRYGTQSMKPGIEPIYVAQKPFEDGLTGTENVIKWGVGAINIDACRIEIDPDVDDSRLGGNGDWSSDKMAKNVNEGGYAGVRVGSSEKGRWPANVITDGSEEVVAAFPDAPGQQFYVGPEHGDRPSRGIYGDFGARPPNEPRGDSGSAARFFYTAKADADDRLGSKHPTVKPLDLMQYLVRLVTPPNGLVLDPFAGTGTTGEAAWREGTRAVLIEAEAEYQGDIRRRMALALSGLDERARESIKAKTKDKPPDHGPLFGGADSE
jgi:site-specific DNA-methyltransferase (adenine-specific)